MNASILTNQLIQVIEAAHEPVPGEPQIATETVCNAAATALAFAFALCGPDRIDEVDEAIQDVAGQLPIAVRALIFEGQRRLAEAAS